MESISDKRIKSFTDLFAWQEGHKLVLEIYRISRNYPADQRFSLTDQLQRSTSSVTANIAEGFGRQTSKDQTHFLYMALGSLKETQNFLILSRDLGFITKDDFKRLADQSVVVSKLLNGFIKSSKSERYIALDKRHKTQD